MGKQAKSDVRTMVFTPFLSSRRRSFSDRVHARRCRVCRPAYKERTFHTLMTFVDYLRPADRMIQAGVGDRAAHDRVRVIAHHDCC